MLFFASNPVFAGATPTLTLTSAASRMAHASGGTFDIPMPLSGTSGVESRTNGTTNRTVVFTFSSAVNGGSASITAGTATIGSVNFDGSEMIVNLNNVSDQQVVHVNVNNVTGTNGGSVSTAGVDVEYLNGDANADRAINVGDTVITRRHNGETLSAANCRYDLNADGQINVGDLIVIRGKAGGGLP